MADYGKATETKIQEVVEACERYGDKAIIALAGVPGTGKSFVASIAGQRFTGEPLLVRETQFHQSFSYEEFIEGLRIDTEGAVNVYPGLFLDWNDRALDDPDRRYLLLIEELTRANLPAVLGEVLTYIEYRERPFLTIYSRRPCFIARNLTVLATYNPTDRSALELDAALLRRMRIVRFLPSEEQLREMLSKSKLSAAALAKLEALFQSCAKKAGDQYEYLMPFGHGIFATVMEERPDLHRLWEERIQHMLRRPLLEPHPLYETIRDAYPWRDPNHQEG
jgi:5-methylcytosine-specific restriction endonuclease McrBC GTP-binding regulatory subunit McrB